MAKLDISQSAFSGFDVIRRNWLAPGVWGLVQVVLALLPLLFVGPLLLEYFSTIFGEISRGGEPNSAEVMRLSSQLNMVQPISWITQLLAQGLVTGAIIRAVLHPEDKRWFFMRLGMGEVMLVAVSLVFTILYVLAILVAAIVVAIVGFAVAAASREAGIGIAILLGIAAFGVLIWGSLRFSLAFAMSHDKKQFLLFESWNKTRGHAGSLFGMGLLSLVVGGLISMVVAGVMLAIGAFAVLGNGGFEALQALDASKDFSAFFTPERTQALIAFGILYLIVASAINGYVGTILTAPWAEAYRQLGREDEEVF
ncbi:MAG: hypothetical protein Q7T61_04350 [Caulobacter sp.]|nr:hypothetical protein [Caulobacter sp.]